MMMPRRLSALAAAATLLGVMAAPAAAGPPAESGVVIRFVDTSGFGIFPIMDHGYWVFANVDRAAFCAWFYDMEGQEFPDNLVGDGVQLVFANDAVVGNIDAGGPTTLHAFSGAGPGDDPCTGSVVEPAMAGDVQVRINDNDFPNMGTRANSFGDRGQGTLSDAEGNRYHVSWNFRAVWAPEDNRDVDGAELKVVTDKFNLHPIGG